MNLNYPKIIPLNRAVFSFLNPGVFVVITKLQKAEIRPRPFPEPPNSGGALAPPAPPLNTALPYVALKWLLRSSEVVISKNVIEMYSEST